MYDFTGNSVNTTVQFVADMVKEQWVSALICVRSNESHIWIIQVCGSHCRRTGRISSCWVRFYNSDRRHL